MLQTTLGQLLINDSLPEDLRDYDRVLDKGGIKKLLQTVAETRPHQYREIAKKISDVGRDAAFTSGGYSFGLKALRTTLAAKKAQIELRRELRKVYAEQIPDDAKEAKILQTVGKYQKTLPDEVYEESKAEGNPLAYQSVSGARGNKFNVNSLRGADLLYTDHRGRPLPIPVLRNYSQGLRPYEYFAGAFGARKGVMDLKAATQDAGFFAKQLVQAAHRLLVSKMDDDNPYDEANPRGYPVSSDDMDSVGSLLAHPVGGYPRNVQITPKMLKDLRERGFDEILARSPIVGGPQDGSVYARDVGVRERGGLSPVGDYVGIAAAQALAEPVTQAQISSKHSGGVAGAGAGAISGFKYINQLVQVPKTFRGGAAHSQLDGTVGEIVDAPQGGKYVTIGNEKHYVAHGMELKVQKGDKVEAGDVLSDGVPNPAEIVRHKGIGDGRRYFVDAFRDALKNSGTYGNRRNIELLARGLINHVRLTDEVGDYAPDDVVPYQFLESSWRPRAGFTVVPPKLAVGRYLEKPVLHYTIGTKIQPSMLPTLEKHRVASVYAHNDPPPFQPEMIRGMAISSYDPDAFDRMLGSYQKKSLLEAVARGGQSDEEGSSYVPSLMRGTSFGRVGMTQGWKPTDVVKPATPAVSSS